MFICFPYLYFLVVVPFPTVHRDQRAQFATLVNLTASFRTLAHTSDSATAHPAIRWTDLRIQKRSFPVKRSFYRHWTSCQTCPWSMEPILAFQLFSQAQQKPIFFWNLVLCTRRMKVLFPPIACALLQIPKAMCYSGYITYTKASFQQSKGTLLNQWVRGAKQ